MPPGMPHAQPITHNPSHTQPITHNHALHPQAHALSPQAYAVSANFSGADMTNAVVDRVVFDKANLKGVVFKNAVITGATFEDADLTATSFEDALIGSEDAKRLYVWVREGLGRVGAGGVLGGGLLFGVSRWIKVWGTRCAHVYRRCGLVEGVRHGSCVCTHACMLVKDETKQVQGM